MRKSSCPSGSGWDSLLRRCISHPSLGLTPSTAPPDPDGIGPGVWICVGLVVSGTLLLLMLLWFIIYRRCGRISQNTGKKDTAPHTLTSIEQKEEALSPWLHLNGQAQEVPMNEGSCGRSLCNGRAEHALPLPATELGDSALVTAKTGQPVEV